LRFCSAALSRSRPRRTPQCDGVQRDRATIFEGVPAMFISLLSYPHPDRYDLSSLRIAISGGASIPALVLEAFEKRFGMLIQREAFGSQRAWGYGIPICGDRCTSGLAIRAVRQGPGGSLRRGPVTGPAGP